MSTGQSRPWATPWIASFFVAAIAGGDALAQEHRFRSLDAVAGQQLRLGLAGTVSDDCRAGPAPEVVVVTLPKNGQLVVRDGRARPDSLPRCPGLSFPTRSIYYQPRARYSGTDEVTYEIRRPGGRVRVHTVRITVAERSSVEHSKPGDASSDRAREGTDMDDRPGPAGR